MYVAFVSFGSNNTKIEIVAKCAAAGKLPPPGWTNVDKNVSAVSSPTTRELGGSEYAQSDFHRTN